MSINKVFLSGNLTRAAESRQTRSGMAVVSFGMAVNDRRKNPQTGEWEDVPNYVDVTVFGQYGERIAGYLVKGAKVMVEGRLQWRQWEQGGEKRSKLEVIADKVELPPRAGGQQQQYPAQMAYVQDAYPGTVVSPVDAYADDDIGF